MSTAAYGDLELIDIDVDGALDIAVEATVVYALLNDGSGGFSGVTTLGGATSHAHGGATVGVHVAYPLASRSGLASRA